MIHWLLAAALSYASGPQRNCQESLTSIGNVQAFQLPMAKGECSVSIRTVKYSSDLIYRDYLAFTNGLLLVFNSYGEGDEQTHTGAREFYFLPRVNDNFSIQVEERERSLKLRLADGAWLMFSADNAQA